MHGPRPFAPRRPPAGRPFTRRSLLAAGSAFALSGLLPAGRAAGAAPAPGAAGPSVYLLRGFAGVFSAGLDQIDATLRAAGVETRIGSHLGWREMALDIRRRHGRPGAPPVVLIGHSLGANAAISIAGLIEADAVPVRRLFTFAATAPAPLPGNVETAVNFYFSHDGWGLPLQPGPRFHGALTNRDYAGKAEIGHFNIDKQPALQREVVRDTLASLRRR